MRGGTRAGAKTITRTPSRHDSITRSGKERARSGGCIRDEEVESSDSSGDSDMHGGDATEGRTDYVAVVDCNRRESPGDGDGEYGQHLRRLWCDLLDC